MLKKLLVLFFGLAFLDLAISTIALTALITGPAWAQNGPPCLPFPACIDLPGPAGGILAGGAILGAIVITKWWRRR